MKLNHGIHLAYCTNVHRGETWAETFAALDRHTLEVRRRVAPGAPYAVGLRLGRRAAEELSRREALTGFRRWLDRNDCYVFTLNGFPYGSFHGTRVKEQVYAPDWSTPERLAYTNLLFDLISEIAPPGVAGSVSTVPGSFKAFVAAEPGRRQAIFANLTACAEHIDALSRRTGRDLHLGLEPEPCCLFETSAETVAFIEEWRARDPRAAALRGSVGVNYDCCHLAIEFEDPRVALDRFHSAGIRISKLHLSSALRTPPDERGRRALAAFNEPTYLHQVVVGRGHEVRRRFIDLPEALAEHEPAHLAEEWRVHFHIPLHAAPGEPFGDTRDHLLGALDWMAAHPGECEHFEMETYTWEVLPANLRLGVEDQLVREYAWTLQACAQRGLAEQALADACAREAGACRE